MPSIVTFNANNFFLRYKFDKTYPGDMSKKSANQALDAVSGFMPGLSFGNYSNKKYIVWDETRRVLAGDALKSVDNRFPDILCLQEVENIQAIRAFNSRYLDGFYDYSFLVDGYDPRNIDVGVLSKFPIEEVRSHIDDRDSKKKRVFSRDCLEFTIALGGGERLTVFLNHFKSKYVKSSPKNTFKNRLKKSHNRRLGQAKAVMSYIEERFAGEHDNALYVVVGDFNDSKYSPYLKPMFESPLLHDVVSEHRGQDDAWTYYWKSRNRVSQIDFVLGSREFARRVRQRVNSNSKRKPHIERSGLAYELNTAGIVKPAKVIHFEEDKVTTTPYGSPPSEIKVPFDFDRYDSIWDDWKNNVSDHCPVKVWF